MPDYDYTVIQQHYNTLVKSSSSHQQVQKFCSETKPDLLKEVLLYRKQKNESILSVFAAQKSSSFSHLSFIALLQTAARFGFAKELLNRDHGQTLRELMTPDENDKGKQISFSYYLNACALHGIDMKTLLTRVLAARNSISFAVEVNLNATSLQCLLLHFEKYLVKDEEIENALQELWVTEGLFGSLVSKFRFTAQQGSQNEVANQVLMMLQFCAKHFRRANELDQFICYQGQFATAKGSDAGLEKNNANVMVVTAHVTSPVIFRSTLRNAVLNSSGERKSLLPAGMDPKQYWRKSRILYRDFYGKMPETPRKHNKNVEDVAGEKSSCVVQ